MVINLTVQKGVEGKVMRWCGHGGWGSEEADASTRKLAASFPLLVLQGGRCTVRLTSHVDYIVIRSIITLPAES